MGNYWKTPEDDTPRDIRVDLVSPTDLTLVDVRRERRQQDEKWGSVQQLPNGTGHPAHRYLRELWQSRVDMYSAAGTSMWLPILLEEVYEAACETETEALRAELVQVAAVAVKWIEALDAQQ